MLTLLPRQMTHFRQMQLVVFAHSIADEICALRLPGCHGEMDLGASRGFAVSQSQAAQAFGLDGEFMVKGFVLCAWYYGSSFHEQPPFAALLQGGPRRELKQLFLERAYLCEDDDG